MIAETDASESIAILDTCVLVPSALNDLLLRTASAGLYRLAWTDEILEEVRRNLIETGMTDEARAQRRIAAMRVSFPQGMIRGYEPLIPTMPNHPKDRHVLAAAVVAGASRIVTLNLRDFTHGALAPFGIEAKSPDDFLLGLLSRNAATMREILDQQAAFLRNPPSTTLELLQRLGLHAPRFAGTVAAFLLRTAE